MTEGARRVAGRLLAAAALAAALAAAAAFTGLVVAPRPGNAAAGQEGVPGAAAPASGDPAGASAPAGVSAARGIPEARSPAVVPIAGRRVLRVGAHGDFSTIGAALDAAAPGDTVRVEPGTYRERLVVERPAVLLGEGAPVVDAGGEGHVVEATAGLEIRGFVLRGSGTDVDHEDAGVMVRGAPARVVENRIEDVLYGVYLKEAPGSVIRGNEIRGKELPLARRGDGIRLWYSSGTRIEENRVVRTRDVVVFFSDHLQIRRNVITDGRYGLHYMYSNRNVFTQNRFERNDVGAFIMYSAHIRLRHNVFADSRGVSGFGLGLKDTDDVVAEENLWVRNRAGVYLDNSPRARDAENRFRANLFFLNDTALRMLPSVRGNLFAENDFVANERPAEVSGGSARGQAAQNRYRRNYWSDYAGFDRDGDGLGDTPFVHARLSDALVARHPTLRLFTWSPVFPVVDAVSRFFPLLQPVPVVVDSTPDRTADVLKRWEASPPVPEAVHRVATGRAPTGTAGGAAAAGPARRGPGVAEETGLDSPERRS